MNKNSAQELSEKEKKVLDRKMELLEPKMSKAKREYDSLVSQYAELLELRHPEMKEERIKDTLYQAYQESDRSLEEFLAFMAGGEYDYDE